MFRRVYRAARSTAMVAGGTASLILLMLVIANLPIWAALIFLVSVLFFIFLYAEYDGEDR
jgi:hypothetical protein